MSLGRGTPFDALFAALTERMRIPHTATPDSAPTQRPRAEWENAGIFSARRGFRRQGNAFTGWRGVKYKVSFYAATELEVIDATDSFESHLDQIVGPAQGAPNAGDGYDIGAGTPVVGGKGDAALFSSMLLVTLYLPIFQLVYGEEDVAVGGVQIRTNVLPYPGGVTSPDTLNPLQATA